MWSRSTPEIDVRFQWRPQVVSGSLAKQWTVSLGVQGSTQGGHYSYAHARSKEARAGDEISPQSVEDYYNQNQDRFRTEKRIQIKEIVFSGEDNDSNKTIKDQAKHVHSLILKGGDFDAIASSYGQSPFRGKSGDWGVFVTPKEIRNSTIRKNAFSLKDQEISQPFRVNLAGTEIKWIDW